MGSTSTRTERVKRRRDKMRAAGLRPVQLWVPDTRAPGFAEEYARQFRVVSEVQNIDHEVDAFLDEINAELAAELDRLEQ